MQLPQLRSRRRHLPLHHSHAGTEELQQEGQPSIGANGSEAGESDAADPAGEHQPLGRWRAGLQTCFWELQPAYCR